MNKTTNGTKKDTQGLSGIKGATPAKQTTIGIVKTQKGKGKLSVVKGTEREEDRAFMFVEITRHCFPWSKSECRETETSKAYGWTPALRLYWERYIYLDLEDHDEAEAIFDKTLYQCWR